MKLASFTKRQPNLLAALVTLAQRIRSDAQADALIEDLSGITVLVAKKFTNERTAEGLQEALYLTMGCISLGLSQAEIPHNAESELNFLLEQGAEQVFQAGFRHIKTLALMPSQTMVTDFDNDPYIQQRNIKALFSELCRAEPNSHWRGDEDYRRELQVRSENQSIIDCAKWLRKNHFAGPVKDQELDANAVISISVIFAIAGDGRIVARTGQKEIENLIQRARKSMPDVNANWEKFLEQIPVAHQPWLSARMNEYRDTLVKKILSKTRIKTMVTEIQNYHAGLEQDVDYD
ncbi:hypothetical protein [Gallionella capsiferriformans]|uniref:Uncharacterized protein n=1 Tax=Gallionella capsiferriformans (strain ES-2) TaxID=395494 RepID=D9SFD6_GALCS|nr:hypothetical protein [Gallionella capsiferriformans]ADL55233.1 hypothetical protein Galf_1205 [Gallionella capsiferriformans ES-2]